MKARDILVATHGHCFDGLASAALFTRLTRALASRGSGSAPLSFRYRSCGYGPQMQQIPEAWLDGDESVILDFRYTPSKKLSWYFDHHITGFASTAERDVAIAGAAAGDEAEARPQVHYDPTYGSCAKLVADVAKQRFGVDMTEAAELVAWADMIDAARFPTAEAATDPDAPVLQLAGVVEHHGDGPFLNTYAPRLADGDVMGVAKAPEIQALWAPIRAARESIVKRVQRAAEVRGPVVMVDLADAPLEVAAKFVTYALYPQCTYSVMITRNKQHFKISVGYNPWSGATRAHDIASICKRYGGGGHPAVGACSFPLNAAEAAREAARTIVAELGASVDLVRGFSRGFLRGERARPIVIGHRGLKRAGFVENTLPAFEQAAIEGAEAIELDVRVCASGELVVVHDPTLERITEKADTRAVVDLTLDEITRVPLPYGARLSSLAEVLAFARARRPRLAVNIEMKRDAPSRSAIVRAVARLLERWDPAHGIIVSSFDPAMLALLAILAPRVPRAVLVHRTWYQGVHAATAIPIGAAGVHLCRTLTRPELVKRLVDRGLVVNVWTVNDPAEARDLADLGVSGIITDVPGEIRDALA